MTRDDYILVESLVAKYRRSFREEHYGGIWKILFEHHHRPLHEVFMHGSIEDAAAILRNPADNFLFYGFEDLFKDHPVAISDDPAGVRQLGEALGTERLPYPEAPKASFGRALLKGIGQKLNGSTEQMLKRLDARLGGRINFPNPYTGEGGMRTPRGIASYRAILSVYQASLVTGRVLEIGGGLGRAAYYAMCFGATEYTIVDLPFTGISQGYFLGNTIGHGKVKLLSPDEFFASSATYDVAINVDSLPEMSRADAERYAAAIKARAASFISINHEHNDFTVQDLFGRAKARHPYWMRTGYVEEWF